MDRDMLDAMDVLKFFKITVEELKKEGKDDEAFYFEQTIDWLQRGKSLPKDNKSVIMCLGL
jgi:hypothetical protein|tara:strand:- start:337 stop:519 length:183 start_codon:yes stop_codon:yes gene_type:complete